jgi:hypothetical protein
MSRAVPAVALLALAGCFRNAPAPGKPVAPIEVEARLEGDPSADFAVVARASTRIDADVDLEIHFPAGVTAGAGARRVAARSPELRVTARAEPGARREILVRATIQQGGARLTRVVPIVIGEGPPEAQGVLKTNSRGEKILEFAR